MGVFGSDMTIQAAVDRTSVQPGDTIGVKVFVGGERDDRVQGARVELACINRFHKKERDHNSDGPDHDRTVTRAAASLYSSHRSTDYAPRATRRARGRGAALHRRWLHGHGPDRVLADARSLTPALESVNIKCSY